jgi:hypothetical protein
MGRRVQLHRPRWHLVQPSAIDERPASAGLFSLCSVEAYRIGRPHLASGRPADRSREAESEGWRESGAAHPRSGRRTPRRLGRGSPEGESGGDRCSSPPSPIFSGSIDRASGSLRYLSAGRGPEGRPRGSRGQAVQGSGHLVNASERRRPPPDRGHGRRRHRMGRPVLFARRNHDRDRSDPGVSPDGSDIFRMKIDGSISST